MLLRIHTPLLIAVALLLGSFLPASAQNVVDFFILLPDEAFAPWNETFGQVTREKRQVLTGSDATKKAATAKELLIWELEADTKNGHLSFDSNGDGEGMNFRMTYWREKKKPGGPCLIAVVIDSWSVASHSTSLIKFYRWKPDSPKTLEDVSSQHIPALATHNFFKSTPEAGDEAEAAGLKWWWILPRQGTTIRIQGPEVGEDQLADKLGPPRFAYDLIWNGTDFTMKREELKD